MSALESARLAWDTARAEAVGLSLGDYLVKRDRPRRRTHAESIALGAMRKGNSFDWFIEAGR